MSGWGGAGDSRFFARVAPIPLTEVAAVAGGTTAAPERPLSGVGPLQTAGPDELSFLDNRRYAPLLEQTRAGAVIVHPDQAARVPEGCAAILTTTPYLGWARAAALFHPKRPLTPGVHPTACVAGARVDPTAEIGPFASIAAGAEIAAGCHIDAFASIGPGVVLGEGCRIGAHASVSHALLGARVTLHPGARVGQEGFGFAPDGDGGFVTVPQLGRVLLGDDVEVGANSTIDRGSAQDTVVGAGTRIDNLVQIGHNVQIGRGCVIVAQVGISGSTVIEDFVMLGGQAGVTGHLRIGRGARIGAQSGVMNDVPAGEEWVGVPAGPARAYLRQLATLRKMAAAWGKGGADGRRDG